MSHLRSKGKGQDGSNRERLQRGDSRAETQTSYNQGNDVIRRTNDTNGRPYISGSFIEKISRFWPSSFIQEVSPEPPQASPFSEQHQQSYSNEYTNTPSQETQEYTALPAYKELGINIDYTLPTKKSKLENLSHNRELSPRIIAESFRSQFEVIKAKLQAIDLQLDSYSNINIASELYASFTQFSSNLRDMQNKHETKLKEINDYKTHNSSNPDRSLDEDDSNFVNSMTQHSQDIYNFTQIYLPLKAALDIAFFQQLQSDIDMTQDLSLSTSLDITFPSSHLISNDTNPFKRQFKEIDSTISSSSQEVSNEPTGLQSIPTKSNKLQFINVEPDIFQTNSQATDNHSDKPHFEVLTKGNDRFSQYDYSRITNKTLTGAKTAFVTLKNTKSYTSQEREHAERINEALYIYIQGTRHTRAIKIQPTTKFINEKRPSGIPNEANKAIAYAMRKMHEASKEPDFKSTIFETQYDLFLNEIKQTSTKITDFDELQKNTVIFDTNSLIKENSSYPVKHFTGTDNDSILCLPIKYGDPSQRCAFMDVNGDLYFSDDPFDSKYPTDTGQFILLLRGEDQTAQFSLPTEQEAAQYRSQQQEDTTNNSLNNPQFSTETSSITTIKSKEKATPTGHLEINAVTSTFDMPVSLQIHETPQDYFLKKGWNYSEARESARKLPLKVILTCSENFQLLSEKDLRRFANKQIRADLTLRAIDVLTQLCSSDSNNRTASNPMTYYQDALDHLKTGKKYEKVTVYYSQLTELYLHGIQDTLDSEKTTYVTNYTKKAEEDYNLPRQSFHNLNTGILKRAAGKYKLGIESDKLLSDSNKIILSIYNIGLGKYNDGKKIYSMIDPNDEKIYITDNMYGLITKKLGMTHADYGQIQNSSLYGKKPWIITR